MQETLLQDTDNIDFRGFTLLNTFSGIGPHGGSSILIRQGVLHSPLNLTTNLQAVAVRLTLHVAVTLCSLYIPPSHNIQQRELINYQHLLLSWVTLMVTTLYGVAMIPIIKVNTLRICYQIINCVFLMMVQILTCILQVEHILPLIYLLLIQDFKWYVHDDLCASDHFPTVLQSFTPCPTNSVPRWNFNKGDWDRFVGLCKEKITSDTFQHDTDPIESFSNLLINIASDSIPKTSTVPRIKKPWFTQICKDSVKQRKKAEKYFRLHPSPANLNLYKQLQAKTCRTIKNEKRQSWRNFITKINSRTPMSKVWNMIQRIKGKGTNSTVKHLNCDNDILTSKKDIANAKS